MEPTQLPPAEVAQPVQQPVQRRGKAITVEPLLFAYMFSVGVHSTAYQQLLYTGYCLRRSGGGAESSCDGTAAGGSTDAASTNVVDELQAAASRMRFYCSTITILPSVVVCAYLGAWSDRGCGRKRTLLVPPLGAAAAFAAWAVLAHFVGSLDPAYALLASVPLGASGYFTAAVQTSFSYLVAVVRPEARTMRIAVVDATFGLSIVCASFAVGPLLLHLGPAWTYVALAAMNVLAALYSALWMDEAPSPPPAQPPPPDREDGATGADACGSGVGVRACRPSLIVSPIVDYVRCVLKRRDGHVTFHLHASLAAFFLAYASGDGVSDVLYLYLTKVHGFSTSLYGYYTGIDFGLKLVVGMAALLIARRYLRADDLAAAMCGCLSTALAYGVMCAAVAPWMIWLSSGVNCLQLLYSVGIRSHVASLVRADELGKIFAFMSSGQSLLTFLDSLLFNNLYPVTLDFYPGLCFAVASLFGVLALATLAFLRNHARCHRVKSALRGDGEPPLSEDGDADVDDSSRLLPPVSINAD